MNKVSRRDLLALIGQVLGDVSGGEQSQRHHAVQGIGVDVWLGETFASQIALLDPSLLARDKPALEQFAHAILHDPDCAARLRSQGSIALALREHEKFGIPELPSVRYFHAHESDVAAREGAMSHLRLRVWSASTEAPSTPFSPLVLRATRDLLESTAIARFTPASTTTFAVAVRGGAIREALAVLASLYRLSGLALWEFDQARRRFASVATCGMGDTRLSVPAARVDANPRRGIVSQVTPERRSVVYDARDRSAWHPKTDGPWEPFDRTLFRERGWRSCLTSPIVHEGRLLGALSVYSAEPASSLIRREALLTAHADLCGTAIAAHRDRTTLAALTARFDEELLTANVSLGALSLSHDVMHYYRTVSHNIGQAEGYLQTGQLAEARKALVGARETMDRTRPVISAMQKLAAEARETESRKRTKETQDVARVLRDLEPLLRAILPHFTKSKHLDPDSISVDIKGGTRAIAAPPEAIERVVVNLCVNAAQWRASEVAVTCHFDRSESEAHLVVRDNGRGIPKAARDRIFDRFYSGRNGSGLGLYVVRELARRAGGDVFVQSVDHTESVEHRGTAVTVVLPTHTAPADS